MLARKIGCGHSRQRHKPECRHRSLARLGLRSQGWFATCGLVCLESGIQVPYALWDLIIVHGTCLDFHWFNKKSRRNLSSRVPWHAFLFMELPWKLPFQRACRLLSVIQKRSRLMWWTQSTKTWFTEAGQERGRQSDLPNSPGGLRSWLAAVATAILLLRSG